LLSRAEHPPKVILLTSPSPGEGKTLSTVNLGIALAQSGQSVAVIDADLRKGRCHRLLKVSNDSGLANVLAGQIALRSALRQTNVKNFFVLPRGGLPPNPADLLMSRKMQEVLNELRNSFDFVLLDSPPAIAVSDAAVLSAFCDGVLFVFHGQKTTAQAARHAVERMDGVNASLLGVILNGVDIRNPDYVDYRSYYPTYYASMQEEFRNNRQGAGEIWESHDVDGDVIGTAEDLDQVMKDLGFEQRRNADTAKHKENGAVRIGGVVPRQFLDRIADQLGESLGSGAFPTVTDQMAELGESIDEFPKARIWELAQQLSRRITDSQARTRFLRAVSKDIQTYLSA
jgi:capsular exopolysaccharide synthesis family protein